MFFMMQRETHKLRREKRENRQKTFFEIFRDFRDGVRVVRIENTDYLPPIWLIVA